MSPSPFYSHEDERELSQNSNSDDMCPTWCVMDAALIEDPSVAPDLIYTIHQGTNRMLTYQDELDLRKAFVHVAQVEDGEPTINVEMEVHETGIARLPLAVAAEFAGMLSEAVAEALS